MDKLINEIRESQVRTETLLKEYLPRVRSTEIKAEHAYNYVTYQRKWFKRVGGVLGTALGAFLVKLFFGG